ncbi:hypothetical protein C0991_007408 [Blastosporella zonata]|nr:hypothetical protein C0991_007408 [Blastosporella zonata]
MYYGPNPPPMQFPPHSSYGPVYTYPPPQAEKAGRPRTHSHSPTHHSHQHSHTQVHPQSPTVIISQVPRAPTAPPSQSKHTKPPTPNKPLPDKPLPPKSPHKVQQAQPSGSKFQYSKCTGRKKAVCIGINYLGQQNELRGCINDAKHVRDFLISNWGYRAGDIVLLSDDATNPRQQPTRENMLDAMRWLVRGAKPHDSLFFHCKNPLCSLSSHPLTETADSGHGGQTKDLNGDEIDGFDEGILKGVTLQLSSLVET